MSTPNVLYCKNDMQTKLQIIAHQTDETQVRKLCHHLTTVGLKLKETSPIVSLLFWFDGHLSTLREENGLIAVYGNEFKGISIKLSISETDSIYITLQLLSISEHKITLCYLGTGEMAKCWKSLPKCYGKKIHILYFSANFLNYL